ncbi:MAG: hypothetical protein KFKLKKLM_01402 [Flavobacteriales bacterium]|nr:hypothetical protein [Flavobacteriales bacterium]
MPKANHTVNRTNSLASQKLNLTRPLIADRQKIVSSWTSKRSKNRKSMIETDTDNKTTGGNMG